MHGTTSVGSAFAVLNPPVNVSRVIGVDETVESDRVVTNEVFTGDRLGQIESQLVDEIAALRVELSKANEQIALLKSMESAASNWRNQVEFRDMITGPELVRRLKPKVVGDTTYIPERASVRHHHCGEMIPVSFTVVHQQKNGASVGLRFTLPKKIRYDVAIIASH